MDPRRGARALAIAAAVFITVAGVLAWFTVDRDSAWVTHVTREQRPANPTDPGLSLARCN